jgi:lysophospholipase L1-like esterase
MPPSIKLRNSLTGNKYGIIDRDGGAFQRVLAKLKERGNDVLVILGPFNEHMLAEDNRPAFRKTWDGISQWLTKNHIPNVTPEPLPSALYADASHPLTEGYALLAKRLYQSQQFREWLK